jgi:GntR family transcriptional regulator
MKKYELIADIIKKRIINGNYQPNQLLPKQETIAKEFHVSRMTIKKAFDILAIEGLIYKQSGLGTYVMGNIPVMAREDLPANAHDGLTKQLGKERIKSRVIKFEVHFPNTDIQQKLRINAADPIYEILRLRIVDDQPYILEHTFMPIKLVPGLNEKIIEGSIYDYIRQNLKLKFGGAYRKIHADLPQDNDIAYLNAKKSDPILEVVQLVWLNNGKPIEYSASRNRYDKRNYTVLDIKNI